MSKKRNKRNTKNSLKYLKAKRAKYISNPPVVGESILLNTLFTKMTRLSAITIFLKKPNRISLLPSEKLAHLNVTLFFNWGIKKPGDSIGPATNWGKNEI